MIIYILSFSLCSGLLLLVYRILLLPEKFYKFNRFYLFFSLVFSLLVPIISIHDPYHTSVSLMPQSMDQKSTAFVLPSVLTVKEQITKAASGLNADKVIIRKRISNQDVMIFISSLITVMMCVRFLRNLHKICADINFSSTVNLNHTKIVLLDKHITPYSFLKYVFVSKNDFLNDLTEPEIICHEQAHATQLHSLDIIFIELLQAICWFNPFLFLYRKAIGLNHEFLADEFVLENNYDTKAYQHLMVAKSNPSGITYLTSQFNYLTIKKRIIMMNKKTSGKSALYKQFAIVPIVLCAFILFANANEIGKSAIGKKNLGKANLFFYQSDKYSGSGWIHLRELTVLSTTAETLKTNIADTSRNLTKKQNHKVANPTRKSIHPNISPSKSNSSETAVPVKAAAGNTFSTNAPASSDIRDKHNNDFSTGSAVREGGVNTFSTGTTSTFSTAAGKEHSSSNDVVDFTNKLILIKGREATKEELRTLSLEKIKFIKPFKGTDDLGAGTFQEIYGIKAKDGGYWVELKTSDN